MKKMLALALIFVISASASAGIIDLQISGVGPAGNIVPIAPTNEITVAPSHYVWLDVIYNPAGGPALYSADTYIIANGPATIEMVGLTYPTGAWDLTWPGSGGFVDSGGPYITVTAGLMANGVAEGIVVDHILFHCEGPGVVTVVPVLSQNHGGSFDFDFNEPLAGAGVIIHQIPEPFTMALLALGGLVTLRRRR